MATNNISNAIYPIGTVSSKDPYWDDYTRSILAQGAQAIPRFPNPEALEDYIKKVREQNYWCEIEQYKQYLVYCEKHFPDDRVYGYHQRDKWKAAIKTFKESGLFE